MNIYTLTAASATILAPIVYAQNAEQPSAADSAAEALQNKKYKEAITLLTPYIDRSKELKDPDFTLEQLYYLAANAYLHLKDYKNCQTLTAALEKDFPDSQWKLKAVFLRAETYARQNQYEQAMKIYESQARRLFTKARKQEVARDLIKFAEIFTKAKDPNDLNSPAPNYSKAYNLYKEILDLECGTTLREQARLSMIEMQRKLSNHKEVERLCLEYFTEFDLSWRGKIGSVQRVTLKKNLNTKAAGTEVGKVRYQFAEALHRQERRREADVYLFELIKLSKNKTIKAEKGLVADATWLRLHTLTAKGGLAFDLDEWVEAASSYLKDFPDHTHANKTAYLLGSMLQKFSKKEEAIKSYQKYITNGYNTGIKKDPLSMEPENEQGFTTRNNKAEEHVEKAMFNIGHIHASSNQFDKAKQAWNNTIKTYPNGAMWSTIQRRLAELDYNSLIHKVNLVGKNKSYAKMADEAVTLIDTYIESYPLDTRVSNLLFMRGNIAYTLANRAQEKTPKNKELAKTLYNKAITNWNSLHSKYARSGDSRRALFLTAKIYDQKLANIEKAIEFYTKASTDNARMALQQLKSRQLVASAPKIFTNGEEANIKLTTRNIEKVKVHQYWLDIESYFLKSASLDQATALDVDLVEPDKSWDFEVADYKKHKQIDSLINIPFPEGKPGICIIKVESEDFVTTSIVKKSNIDIAIRSSKSELIAFAKNWKKESAASKVKLIIADGEKVVAKGETDENGVFHSKFKQLKDLSKYRVLAISEEGAAVCNQSLANLVQLPKIGSKAWFTLDRNEIRKGDSGVLTGVIRDYKEGNFIYPTDRDFSLSIRNGNIELLTKDITLTKEGNFSANFKVPATTSNRHLHFVLTSKKDGKISYSYDTRLSQQAEFKGKISVKLAQKAIKLGGIVKGSISAAYRWGAPVANRKVTLNLPSGKQTYLITDADGKATFEYDTTGIASGAMINFSASIPSLTLQTSPAAASIDPLNLFISAKANKETMTAGEEVAIKINTTNSANEKIPSKLKLKLIKQTTPETLSLASGRTSSVTEKTTIQEIDLTTAAENGNINHSLKIAEEGVYILRIEGQDSDGKPSFAETEINVLGDSSQEKLSLYHHNGKIYDDGKATLQLFSNISKPTKALMTIETDHIVKYSIIDIKQGLNELIVPLEASYAPVFRCAIMTMDGHKFISCEDTVAITKKLHVSTKITGLNNGKAKAGSTLKATVEVRDSQGNLTPALLFSTLNPTQVEKLNKEDQDIFAHTPFVRSSNLINFRMSTSCGFRHTGKQEKILAALKAERDQKDPSLLSLPHLRMAGSTRERATLLIHSVERAFNLSDYSSAQNLVNQAISIDPRNQEARKWLAKINNKNRIDYLNEANLTGTNNPYNLIGNAEIGNGSNNGFAYQRRGSYNTLFVGGQSIGNGVSRNGNNFNAPVQSVAIQGIPQSGQIYNLPTSGLRSGDTAITRDSINFFLNNPNRTSQFKQAQEVSLIGNSFDNYSNGENVYFSQYNRAISFNAIPTTPNSSTLFESKFSQQDILSITAQTAWSQLSLDEAFILGQTPLNVSSSSTLPVWQSKVASTTGTHDFEIPLPKQSGKWLLNFNAIGKEGRIGEEQHLIDTVADVDIAFSIDKPVVEGDQFTPTVTVHRSNADDALETQFNLEIAHKGIEAIKATRKVTFKKGEQTKDITFDPFIVKKRNAIYVSIKQVGEDLDKRIVIPVRPWGAASFVHHTEGISAGSTKTFSLKLPAKAEANILAINLLPQFDKKLVALATSRNDSAFGFNLPCYQPQGGGQLLAMTSVLEYLRTVNAADSDTYKRLHQAASWTFNEVLSSMNKNGSWSLVNGRSRPNVAVTAQSYIAIKRWEKLNKLENSSCVSSTNWLTQQYGKVRASQSETRCLIQMALSHSDSADFSLCNRLFRERGKLSTAGKLYLAKAFINLQRKQFARDMIKEILAQKVENWNGVDSIFSKQTNALLGHALDIAGQLEYTDNVTKKLAEQLMKSTSLGGFTNDVSRGFSVSGLAAFQPLLDKNKLQVSKGSGTISINGKEKLKFDLSKPETFKPLFITKDFSTKSEIKVEFKGQGKIFVTGQLTGFTKGFQKHKMHFKQHDELSIGKRSYTHQGLSYKGTPLRNTGSSTATVVEQDQQINVNFVAVNTVANKPQSIILEPIPAGFEYVKGSLSGSHSGARIENNHLVITLNGTFRSRYFTYKLIAAKPGNWKHAATTIAHLGNLEQALHGPTASLKITPTGTKTTDVYETTWNEEYELATLYFNDKEYDKAEKHLKELMETKGSLDNASIAKMNLWIETAKQKPNAKIIVDAFETLDAKMPELNIPFDKILKVGKSYSELEEYERAHYVFAATIDGGYSQDSYVSVALEDQGRLLDAIDYQKKLWYLYPNSDSVNTAWFATAQNLYDQASIAAKLTPRKSAKKDSKLTSKDIYLESLQMMRTFLTVLPEHPSADEASYTIANGLFALEDYQAVVEQAKLSHQRYQDSDLINSFHYMQALGSFWQRKYEDAIKAAAVVTKGDSADKDLATFITAQIYHAKGQPKEAMKWYEKIRGKYPDALNSIQYFEQKKIGFNEIQLVNSKDKATIKLNYRNVKNAELKIYRVDLMKLYLKQKNLSNITKINLAGIEPEHELSIKLDSSDLTEDKEKEVDLPIKKDGAYLVICRGDYLYTSGLVLITPLKMEIQEFPSEGKLRVNVKDKTSDKLLEKVHVKAIGSKDRVFKKGETDLRGIWTTSGLIGAPTVIARDKKGRYAFFRGKQNYSHKIRNIGGNNNEAKKKVDWNRNLEKKQFDLNSKNWGSYDNYRRDKGKSKGIKVNKALKK